MRLLASALLAAAAAWPQPPIPELRPLAPGFAVLSTDHGAWPHILSSVGFQPQAAALAGVFVARAGAPAATHWPQRIEEGAVLILEGDSPLAEQFGFRPGGENVRVASIVDARRPKLPIVWQKALELPKFEVPKAAQVFARERWTGAPVLAGFRRGSGAVLWLSVSPGERGYERFPYILQALGDLGLAPPFRSARLWAFFDYSYRTRVDLDYFAARWRAAGIAALHVAAWHFYERDKQRDEYLNRLILACHRKGILVYAWLELPHVSEKFWIDHPEWREKTAVLQDAHLDWRKLMNLTNRECFRAVRAGIEGLISRFDWDGVNLAELYFESLEGAENPARFTPMNDEVRAEFRNAKGFDPIELFQSRKNPESLRSFLDCRAELARRMQEEWIGEIDRIRSDRPNMDLVLTHVDDRFDTRMREAIGADAGRVLPLLDKHDFTFLIEDPATVWDLGPQRYPEIAKRYQPLTRRTEKLAIDINVVERYQDVYPTQKQTGSELFQLVHVAARAFPRVALYFENSILQPDLALLPAAAAVVDRTEQIGSKLVVASPHGVGIAWRGGALVNGNLWPVGDGSTIWLPAGAHAVQAAPAMPPARILDFNGTLKTARSLAKGGVETTPVLLASTGNYTLYLPRGQHLVTVETE
jgi:hypothetical protein